VRVAPTVAPSKLCEAWTATTTNTLQFREATSTAVDPPPENASATVILRSCCRARREAITVTDVDQEQKFDARQAAYTVALWNVVNQREATAPQVKATRQMTATCNVCNKPFVEHADDVALKCYVCGAFFSYLCAGINREMVDFESPSGKCVECRRLKRHRVEGSP
jgi:hypothetical protein